jgi:hypothetical protein
MEGKVFGPRIGMIPESSFSFSFSFYVTDEKNPHLSFPRGDSDSSGQE